MSAPAPLSQRMQEIIEEWKSDKVCDRSYYINLIEPLVVEVVALEAQMTRTQARLDVTEAILCGLFPEVDDSEIFKQYCKLCAEDDDCEWGDNFPHCFIEKDVGVVGEAQREEK